VEDVRQLVKMHQENARYHLGDDERYEGMYDQCDGILESLRALVARNKKFTSSTENNNNKPNRQTTT